MATEQPFHMHKDGLSADELDRNDPYVLASLGLFAIHNVVRRNLAACAENAKTVTNANIDPFVHYAKYTLHVVEDQFESVDNVWFPGFAKYDDRFAEQIAAHKSLQEKITALKGLLEAEPASLEEIISTQVAEGFQQLHDAVNVQYDTEEALVNDIGRKVPLDEIKELEKQQEERRRQDVKVYGHLWTAVYLLRSLEPKERAIFPPGIPALVVSGMLTAGALQFRRELQFTPKF